MAIKLQLEIEVDDKGAVTAVKKIGDAAKDTSTKVKDAGDAGSKALEGMALKAAAAIAAYVSLSKAIQVSVDFIKQSISASSEAQRIDLAMNNALAARGQLTEKNTKSLNDYANKLQQTTRFEDDAAKAAMTRLLQMRVPIEELPRLMTLAADVSVAKGVDISQGAEAVGRAYNGATRNLEMLIGKMEKQKSSQEGLAESGDKVIKMAEQMLGGSAQAAAQSYADKIQQLKNAYGNLQEAVGNAITQNPVVLAGIQAITTEIENTTTALTDDEIAAYNLKVTMADLAIGIAYVGGGMASMAGTTATLLVGALNSIAMAADQTAYAFLDIARYVALANKDFAAVAAIELKMSALALRMDALADTVVDVSNTSEIWNQKWANIIEAMESARSKMSPLDREVTTLKNTMGGLATETQKVADGMGNAFASVGNLFPAEGLTQNIFVRSYAEGTPAIGMPTDEEIAQATAIAQQFIDNKTQMEMDYQSDLASIHALELTNYALFTAAKGAIDEQYKAKRVQMEKEALAVSLAAMGSMIMGAAQGNIAMFRFGQALSIASVIIQAHEAFAKTMGTTGAWGTAAAVAAYASVIARVAMIAAQKPPEAPKFSAKGQAHDGMNVIPSTGSYLLQGGEMIVPAKFNPALIGQGAPPPNVFTPALIGQGAPPPNVAAPVMAAQAVPPQAGAVLPFAPQAVSAAQAPPPFVGQAHDGMMATPRTGSYYLDRGEVVIPPRFNPSAVEQGGATINISVGSVNDQDTVNLMAARFQEAVDRGLVRSN